MMSAAHSVVVTDLIIPSSSDCAKSQSHIENWIAYSLKKQGVTLPFSCSLALKVFILLTMPVGHILSHVYLN